MGQSNDVNVFQLRRRDPVAWTALLNNQPGLEKVVATAVTSRPLPYYPSQNQGISTRRTRYFVTLANHSDPIVFIGKRTNATEAQFFQTFAETFPSLLPHYYFVAIGDDTGWLITEDVPNHYPPPKWQHNDIEDIITDLTNFHATYWNKTESLREHKWLPHFVGREQKTYSWEELKQEKPIYFKEGPAAILSEHAIHNAGRLAPSLLEAANGLVVMRDLGGWPGVLGESHLQAAADLIDDPVPMLQPLLDLPLTLLHGAPHPYQWCLTLFNQRRLLNWEKPQIGPGVIDLVCFLEQFDLLYKPDSQQIYVREERPSSEETVIDSYMLALSEKLGSASKTRDLRRAFAAARCLYVITNTFPSFAQWFNNMPDRYTWQRVNRMSNERLTNSKFKVLVNYRPYLSGVFRRFIRAYHSL
ncbi:MAG: hypothetical protein AAF614_11175 [Chloroflexota bacterium]